MNTQANAAEVKVTTCSGLERLGQAGTASCALSSCRGLSARFMTDLKLGMLKPLLSVVKADDTLSLNIREDFVNIYYRGGSLVRISERKGSASQYEFHFDENYIKPEVALSLGLPVPKFAANKTSIVSTQTNAALWVSDIPALKCAMDLYFSNTKQSLEREFQQLVERINNSTSSTDYFICDIEYKKAGCKEFRLDLIALYWPSKAASRKSLDCGRIAIIEMKHNDDAIPDKCGIVDHIRLLDKSAIGFSYLCDEMRNVFNQRVELGLIKCHESSKQPQLTTIKFDEKVDYIILLSDHDPAKSRLCDEFADLQNYLKNNRSRFNIKVAMATFTGYGLYEESICSLDEFISRYGKQIGSSKKRAIRD